MATTSPQLIYAKGKAKALDALFLSNNGETGAPFGFLAVGYSNADSNGFSDPIITGNESDASGGFNELDPVAFDYKRVQLTSADNDPSYTNIDYNTVTGKVTRTYEATFDAENIKGTKINQIAVVSTSNAGDTANTDYYSATTFSTFNKDSQSSITFRISFTI